MDVSGACYRLEHFDQGRPAPAAVLASLHGRLLPDSPVARLGRHFMESFYYACLPRAGLVFGSVAWVAEQPVGLVVATEDSAGFLRRGARCFRVRLLTSLARSLVTRSAAPAALWEAVQLARARGPDQTQMGEILSIGVLPDFPGRAALAAAGIRVSHQLLDSVLDQLRQRAVHLVRAQVRKDNLPARLFYQSQGWRLATGNVPGWHHPCVEYRLELGG